MIDLLAKTIGWLITSMVAAVVVIDRADPSSGLVLLWLWLFFFTTCVAYEAGNELAKIIKRKITGSRAAK